MLIIHVAQDAAEWQENKHPRAPDGKFGSGSGGGSSSAPSHSEGTHLSNKVKGALLQHGYKKVSSGKTEGGTTTYYHGPTKTKVIIHPEEGKKHSSKWSMHDPGGKLGGGEGSPEKSSKSLAELLGKIAGAPAAPSISIKINEQHAEAAKKAIEVVETSAPSVKSLMDEKGYIVQGGAPNGDNDVGVIFKNDKGAKVQYNSDGSWIASTPGHMTKEGQGAKNLEALLSGNPAIISPGGKAPWVNSQKTIAKTAAEKETEEAAQKQMAAANAKMEAEQNAHKNIYKDLQSAAPKPSDAQRQALGYYGSSGYKSLNGSLRSNHTSTAQSDSIKQLDTYLSKSSIPQDVTVYRGVKGEYASIIKSVVMEGTKFIDRGFISTSVQKSTADNFQGGLTMKINVKKGSKGAAIGSYSGHSSEYEVLLPRNSALIVKSYDPKTGHIECDLDQEHL